MTTSIARDLERRKTQSRDKQQRLTLAGDLRTALLSALESASLIRFPSPRYQKDPVAFCREILGVEPWSKQVEIFECVRDHARVAIASGHRVSKSHSVACLALWFYCSFPRARVVMTSVTSRQVDGILWREIKMLRSGAGRCLACKAADPGQRQIPAPCPHSSLIEGDMGEQARTGLKSADFREIVGFTASEAEAVQGIAGPNILFICDEASGIDDAIFEGLEGNRAGGAGTRIVLTGNPTKNDGEFYRAFHEKKDFYQGLYISSEESPNVVEGRIVIDGLASREWVEEKKREWGEDSPMYTVRVKGRFATKEDGKIFSIARIAEAESRWSTAPYEGRLYIGVDPAGPTGTGDETVFCLRRGFKVDSFSAHRGLNEDAILASLLGMIKENWQRRDPLPVVVIDSEGTIGAGLHGRLRQYVESGRRKEFELVAIRASDRAHRNPHIYDKARDELAANLESWFREGGAIPEDTKLSAELHLWEWGRNEANGRFKLRPAKEDAKKVIKRSPDRYDALALACWEPFMLRDGIEDAGETVQRQVRPEQVFQETIPDFSDPYSGGMWGGNKRSR